MNAAERNLLLSLADMVANLADGFVHPDSVPRLREQVEMVKRNHEQTKLDHKEPKNAKG